MSINKFSWRHGSIASRIARLKQLGGRRTDELPIDRTVRGIKAATLIAIGVLLILGVRGAWQGVGGTP
jgi:hypothetical protein